MIKCLSIILILLTGVMQDHNTGGETDFMEPGLIERSDIVFYAGFEGDFNNSSWKQKWGIPWSDRVSDAELITGTDALTGRKSLRVNYPSGGVGPKSTGIQFPVKFGDIKEMQQQLFDSLFLRYYIKFEEGFDFRLGGKLPGLMGGEDSFLRSGGDQPDGTNGWTMRFMWREKGEAVVYAYLPEGKYKEGDWGTDIKLNKYFIPGQWHCIEQFIRINTQGKEDGKLSVWFDNELVLSLEDVNYFTELNNAGMIGGIYFSTFHGGNTPEWAPEITSYTQFDGIAAGFNRIGLIK